jgi:hypothetical protein
VRGLRLHQEFTFVPWGAASASGATTSGLNSGGESRSGQGKVPSAILVEGNTCTPKGALHVNVFVLSLQNKPLMPTTPRRARLWLKAKRARIVSLIPFTIQLRFEPSSLYTQTVKVGVDSGFQTVGVAAIANGEVLYQAEVSIRTDVKSRLDRRRQYRRNRRGRKTRYRPARFNNRVRANGWLPPSLRSKAEATVKTVLQVARVLPVTQINVEVGNFDTQRMINPEIVGMEYQQGELAGYRVREYLLDKWHRRCAYCGTKNLPLQVEHILPKSRGGTDRVSNLTLACAQCNQAKGKQTATEFGFPDLEKQAQKPLVAAAHVSSIKNWVVETLSRLYGASQVSTSYGYETKYKRIQVLKLPKTHAHDAIAIACRVGERVITNNVCYQIRCLPRGNYQLFNGQRGEHKVSAPKKLYGWKLYEMVEAKGLIGYIGGRRVKGSFALRSPVTGKLFCEVRPSKLRRVCRPQHGWLFIQERIVLPLSAQDSSLRTQ